MNRMYPKTGFKMDWLTFTVPYSTTLPTPQNDGMALMIATRLMRQMGLNGDALEQKDAARHYAFVFECEETGIVLRLSDSDKQGTSILMTGKTIRNIGGSDAAAKAYSLVRVWGARASRVDVAYDYIEIERATVTQVADALYVTMEKQSPAKRKRAYFNDGDGQTETAYIGSRSSDIYHRVYDKATEQGISGMLWTRYELECKGNVAHAFDGNWGAYVKGLLAKCTAHAKKLCGQR